MTDLVVHPLANPPRGGLVVPPASSTCDLAIAVAAAGAPETPASVALRGAATPQAAEVLRACGVKVTRVDDVVSLEPVGPRGLAAPASPLHLPADPTAFGFLLGWLAGQQLDVQVDGGLVDESPLDGAARILRGRGAQIEGRLIPSRPGWVGFPLELAPSAAALSLLEADRPTPVEKAAALGSALAAEDDTFLRETLVIDDRLERLLAEVGWTVECAGPVLRVAPSPAPPWPGGELPGDPVAAIALATMALAHADGWVGIRGVTANPTVTGWVEALRAAGAAVATRPTPSRLGQAVWDVDLRGTPPGPLRFGGERGARAGAPLPLLLPLAAFASGTSELFDVPLEGSSQGEATLALCAAAGLEHGVDERGLQVVAASTIAASELPTAGDPLVAMAATLLALRAAGPCRIRDVASIVTRFPRFVGCLRALGAHIEVCS